MKVDRKTLYNVESKYTKMVSTKELHEFFAALGTLKIKVEGDKTVIVGPAILARSKEITGLNVQVLVNHINKIGEIENKKNLPGKFEYTVSRLKRILETEELTPEERECYAVELEIRKKFQTIRVSEMREEGEEAQEG